MRKKEKDLSHHLQVHQVHLQDLQWTQISFIEEN